MFLNTNLSVLSYGNGFTLWHYVSDDGIEDILSHSYFDKVLGLMHIGDVILICAKGGVYVRYITSMDGEGFEWSELK